MSSNEKFWLRTGTTAAQSDWREVTADEWWTARGATAEKFELPDFLWWGDAWWSQDDDPDGDPQVVEGWYLRDGSHPDDRERRS